MKCRCCQYNVTKSFVDLGHQPPSNAYLTREQLERPETTYPLHAFVCESCWLVQVASHTSASELFTDDYAYFSSVSTSWLDHARRYVEQIVPRLSLGPQSLVVEVASNDGYLLQYIKQAGIPCVGIEPTSSTAISARQKGIETIEEFFGRAFAEAFVGQRGQCDLLIGNNVLAHVPDLNDFVAGVAVALKEDGVATFEFPHLMRLVQGRQFDTIYHEHYSYFSLTTVCNLFERHGLRVFDVDELPTHGGSLRVYATHAKGSQHATSVNVAKIRNVEEGVGMSTPQWYEGFQPIVELIKNDLLEFLLTQKSNGVSVAAYGAAAKGNTLLNFAGVKRDLLPFVCDAAPSKQGKFMPGSHIPIVAPSQIETASPDKVLILPWNIANEIVAQFSVDLVSDRQFLVAIPELRNIQ